MSLEPGFFALFCPVPYGCFSISPCLALSCFASLSLHWLTLRCHALPCAASIRMLYVHGVRLLLLCLTFYCIALFTLYCVALHYDVLHCMAWHFIVLSCFRFPPWLASACRSLSAAGCSFQVNPEARFQEASPSINSLPKWLRGELVSIASSCA